MKFQQARNLDGVNHHEQADEEEDRGPFDFGEGPVHVVRLLGAALLPIVEQHQRGGAGDRNRRRVKTQRTGGDERD